MQSFPNKLKFLQTGLIGELKTIESKDNKGQKLQEPLGVYEYLDDGKRREGVVTKTLYANPKIGSTIKLSMAQIKLLEDRMTLHKLTD